ncbi:type II secretion system protein [Anatilimnocola sp. NA78]|uniref:type II secretion system protein n=1 Tax=Anatilimnocola sp. NA78 TaxID=3415683 RepID=UPI003CE4A0AD
MQRSSTFRGGDTRRGNPRGGLARLRPASRPAFTLVEVLMVVTTLAILAGAIIPQVGSVLDDARHASMLAQLNELSFAMERYQIDHDGRTPDLMPDRTLPQLFASTNSAGSIGSGVAYPLGPYLKNRMPVNPLNDTNDVYRSNTAPPTNLTSRVGWVYHPETGQLWAGLYQGSVPASN